MSALATTKVRLERLADERKRTEEKIEDVLKMAEEDERELGEFENEQLAKYRTQVQDLEVEITLLAADIERANKATDASAVLRNSEQAGSQTITVRENGPVIYRTFAAYARDELITRFPQIASRATQDSGGRDGRDQAVERLQRVLEHTTTSDIAGLLPPTYISEIMDLIDKSRPVVSSGKRVDLERGSITYPSITGRPEVLKQTTEKTQAGSLDMNVVMVTQNADTYLGGGNLSWQAINWSSPSALALWFDLAGEAYARATETAACSSIATAAVGTVGSPVLGTVGTETYGQWRSAAMRGVAAIYSATGGRARTNTLYLAADRFFNLAALATDQTLNLSVVGSLNVDSMTGTFSGLNVVGSYGFTAGTAILGDSSAFLVGETAGAPVELRAVEPAIGGMEVGVIGAFKSVVFDTTRFERLS